MKLSEIRPCDACGGPLPGKQKLPMFYVVRFSPAVFDRQAVNETMGMHQYFQHQSLELAELFAPGSDHAVNVAMDDPKHRDTMTELLLCQDCFLGELNLAVLAEKRTAAQEGKEKADV